MDTFLNIVSQVCCWLVFALIALEVLAFFARVYVKTFPKRAAVSGEALSVVIVRKGRNHISSLFQDIKVAKAHVVSKDS